MVVWKSFIHKQNYCNMKKLFIVLLVIYCNSVSYSQEIQKPNTNIEEIIFVFKTHFDIGYTNLAERILQKYSISMMNETLNTLKESESMPEKNRFVWTLPGWPMKEILKRTSGETKSKIINAIQEQRFAIHAFPFTFETEASDPEVLTRSLVHSAKIAREFGLELPRDAKLTDVPGHSWLIPTILKNAGVDFLHIGCNPASQSPDLPLLFWWQGPDGSKLMTMYWEKYYGTDIIPPDGWPYKSWIAIIHTNDNVGAPPFKEVEKNLKEAHRLAPNAIIKIGRMSDFYDAIMKENPELPVINKDMPDTWVHGYMSMPVEVRIRKKIKANISGLENLATSLDSWGGQTNDIESEIASIYEKCLLFDEHTFGIAMSHGQSGKWYYGKEFLQQRANNTFAMIENSWKEKGLRVHEAELLSNATYDRKLDELVSSININGEKIVVYNPLPWKRSGRVRIPHNSEWFKYQAIEDVESGNIIKIANKNNVIEFLAENIPSYGYKTYIPAKSGFNKTVNSLVIKEEENILENKFIRIQFDKRSGQIISLVNKKNEKEYCNSENEYGLGEYLYEKFSKKNTEQYAGDYIKAGWSWANAELGRPNLTDEPYKNGTGLNPEIVFEEDDIAVSAYLHFSPKTDMPHKYIIKYSLYWDSPKLEITWSINGKPAEPWPEAGWICFPFNINKPEFKLGRTGGISDPSKDYLKGSNHDYCFINSGLAILDDNNSGIGIFSPDVPAISLDRPGLWKYSEEFIPKKSNVFFNLYNNQWSTNFTGWIEGSWNAKFYLWFIEDYDNESSLITPSEEIAVSLKAKISKSKTGHLPPVNSGIELSRKGLSVTAFGDNPDGEGTLLRLWEKSGDSGKIKVTLPAGSNFQIANKCNLRGEMNAEFYKIINNSFEIQINAYQPLSFILE